MKERPILFSGPMVRAILDGRKTQTRRVVKPQPPHDFGPWNNATTRSGGNEDFGCPFGRLGDRLWVRETFFIDDYRYFRCALPKNRPSDVDYRNYYFRADGECCEQVPECECASVGSPWKPSIHMPRWACRLLLDVKSVRVERLQEINGIDALAEGITREDGVAPWRLFKRLWDSINEKRGYGWGTNPWVWVIEFQFVEDSGT